MPTMIWNLTYQRGTSKELEPVEITSPSIPGCLNAINKRKNATKKGWKLINTKLIDSNITLEEIVAFLNNSRNRIWARDKGKCKSCGRSVADGWNLDCSHHNHDASAKEYNEPSNGQLECLICHLKRHLMLWKVSIEKGDKRWEKIHKYGSNALANRILAGEARWDMNPTKTEIDLMKKEIKILFKEYGFEYPPRKGRKKKKK